MHEHVIQLLRREVEAILPHVPAFDVVVFLHLQIVGHHGEVPLIPAQEAPQGEGDRAVVGRHGGGVVHRVIQQPCIFGAPFLVVTQQGMPEHAGGVIDKERGEDQADRFGVDASSPALEPIARQARKAGWIESELAFQPAEAGGKGALGRHLGRLDRFPRIEAGQGRLQFGLRVGFAVGGKEKSGTLPIGGIAGSHQIGAIVQQQVPEALLPQSHFPCASVQLVQVGFPNGCNTLSRGYNRCSNDQ